VRWNRLVHHPRLSVSVSIGTSPDSGGDPRRRLTTHRMAGTCAVCATLRPPGGR